MQKLRKLWRWLVGPKAEAPVSPWAQMVKDAEQHKGSLYYDVTEMVRDRGGIRSDRIPDSSEPGADFTDEQIVEVARHHLVSEVTHAALLSLMDNEEVRQVLYDAAMVALRTTESSENFESAHAHSLAEYWKAKAELLGKREPE